MATILTAHQPAYLPWLGLFHKIAFSDTYIYLDSVQFEKNSFTNRNKIKSANGAFWLTVPVKLKGHFQKAIKEIEIDNAQDWRKSHFKSIYLNYKKAPFFNRYFDFFKDTYEKEWQYLADLNEYMLKWFLKELGIKAVYYKSSEQNFESHKSDLILEICQKFKADIYVSGALGKDYVKEEDFSQKGIKAYFQDYIHPVYPQFYNGFLPYMSIIDLLFNCGGKSLEILMQGNITKQDLIKKFNL